MPNSPVPLEPIASRLQHLFPTLTAAQTVADRRAWTPPVGRSVATCWSTSETRSFTFFVVVTGEIHVVQPSAWHRDAHRSFIGPGQFSGEGTMITGRRALARLRVNEPGEVIELDREHLLALVQTDAELSEILMRAFILRRVELIARGLGRRRRSLVLRIAPARCESRNS